MDSSTGASSNRSHDWLALMVLPVCSFVHCACFQVCKNIDTEQARRIFETCDQVDALYTALYTTVATRWPLSRQQD
jgi:hypothetical protein